MVWVGIESFWVYGFVCCLVLDQVMRLRLGERTKLKVGRVSNSSNLHIKDRLRKGDFRLRFSLTCFSYLSLLLSSFCLTKMDQDKGLLFL